MDWVDRPQNYKGSYGILQLLHGSQLDNFPLKTLKLGWVAFHPIRFQLKCLDFQSNQYTKLAPVLSRFCNGLWHQQLYAPKVFFCCCFLFPKVLDTSNLVCLYGLHERYLNNLLQRFDEGLISDFYR